MTDWNRSLRMRCEASSAEIGRPQDKRTVGVRLELGQLPRDSRRAAAALLSVREPP